MMDSQFLKLAISRGLRSASKYQLPLLYRSGQIHQTIYRAIRSPGFTQLRPKSTTFRNSAEPKSPPRIAPTISEVQDEKRQLLALRLIQDGKSVLWKAPSHSGFAIAGFVTGTFCLTCGLLTVVMDAAEDYTDLPWYVPVTARFGVVIVLGGAGVAFLRTSRLISSVELVRVKDRARIMFKVRRNIPLPFIPPRRLVVDFSDVIVQRRLVVLMDWSGRKIQEKWASGVQLRLAERIKLMLFHFYASTKQFFDSSGLIYLYIKGRKGFWKLSAYGLALDGGQPFHELVEFQG